MIRAATGVLAAALVLGAGAACGIPEDGSPRPIADRDVPFGLLETTTSTPAATTVTR